MTVGLIGQVYPGMTDMPIDEARLLRATGRMMARPEVEEIEEAYHRVSADQLEEMYTQFRASYDVDESVTNEHMRISTQIAVAYDEIIRKHDIFAFGYYWWGEKELITQLRAQFGVGGHLRHSLPPVSPVVIGPTTCHQLRRDQ